jgi:phosphate transport system permease protein
MTQIPATTPRLKASAPVGARPQRAPRKRGGTSLLAHGENMVWLMGGSLAICVVMIVGLLALIIHQGATTFWPRPIVEVTLADGTVHLGQVTREDDYRVTESMVESMPSTIAERARPLLSDGEADAHRRLFRTGNFELTNAHFNWVDGFAVVEERREEWALVLERRAWGRFYGYPKGFLIDGNEVAATPETVMEQYHRYHDDISERFERRYNLQKYEFGEVHAHMEKARLDLKSVAQEYGEVSPEYAAAKQEFNENIQSIEARKNELTQEIELLDTENSRYAMVMEAADGREATIEVAEIVRAVPANRLGAGEKLGVYLSRWKEFLADDPREANSEGGVWPAIVGTVIMTLLMSVAVVPFGVLASLYLREYAKAGPLVSAVRIAVNNLAGVPSIVFGVFGLGFFCYIMGASIDEMFFAAKLPNPTFGKGGVLWASLTLALLTLPVVVVSTEEALAAVPGSMREGSYACGASKWQTIRRIVLPRAMPGIMTGFILAMARGAGEVAPLMLVGAVKLAPDLPIDGVFPYLHADRSFMHLGFHIYDVGFQSQNSEAAKPMVFTTTLLLIAIIAALNLVSVWVRTRLRKKFLGSAF